MKLKTRRIATAFVFAATCAASAVGSDSIPVTVDNFVRAESDLYFGGVLKDAGGIGRFFHNRKPTPIDNQTVIRMNRDTLYSGAVFDLDAGPVTITLPDASKRFTSMQVINEDEYTPMVVYDAGAYTLTKDKIGTRYVVTAIRTLADPNDAKDIQQANSLQDAIKVEQPGGSGVFEVPNWDQTSQKKGARRPPRARLHATGFQRRVRQEGRGRSGAPSDRRGGGLGRQPREGRYLPQRHAREERWRNRLQAQR